MRISVLGAGNGGQATAAWLARAGHAVRLFDRFPDAITGLRAAGRIRATGAFEAHVRPEVITDDMAEAAEGAELIVVTVPGFAQEYIATTLAPFLRGGETVLLHPGGLGGALEVRHTWDLLDVPANVTLAETDTLLFACRLRGVGEVDVKAVKRHLLLATLPGDRVDAVVALVRGLFPPVVPAANVLETSLANLNPVIHPVITLLNAGPIERNDTSFDFYGSGVTAATARLLETVDAERLAVAAAAGVTGIALLEWASIAYGVAAPDLLTLYPLLARDVYQGIGRPANLEARYITEDVPLGMVPLTVIARMVGVPTPRIDAVIEVLSTMNGADYRSSGRTAERMGIAGFGRTDLLGFVETGKARTPDT